MSLQVHPLIPSTHLAAMNPPKGCLVRSQSPKPPSQDPLQAFYAQIPFFLGRETTLQQTS